MELAPVARWRALDANANPLAGGKLYTYAAGTTTPQSTYTDQGGLTANANPVVLDANGEANVWLNPSLSYKFVLKDSSDVTQWTTDNIVGTLTPDAVNTASIQDGAVTTAKIADDAVTADKLRDDASVDANRAVTTNHIRNEAITRAKKAAGAMGVLSTGVSSETAAFTASVAKDVYLCSASGGAYTVTLPTAVGNGGKEFVFKKTDTTTNAVTLDGNGSETIDGLTTYPISCHLGVVRIISDGTNWQVLFEYGKSGSVIGSAYAELSSASNTGSVIPFDDTIPQITEGTEILTVAYTPKAANSKLEVEFHTHVSEGSNVADTMSAALFRDADVNAIAAAYVNGTTGSAVGMTDADLSRTVRVANTSLTATTFRLRVGAGAGASSIYWNSTAGGTTRVFGAMPKTMLIVREIAL